MEVYIGLFIVINCLALTFLLAIISLWLLLRSGDRKKTKRVDESAPVQSEDEEETSDLEVTKETIEEEVQGIPIKEIPKDEDVLPSPKVNHLSPIGRFRHQRLLRRRAKLDYQIARGTIHKGQIKLSLAKLEAHIRNLKRTEEEKIRNLEKLDSKRDQELRKALSDYLVKYRLTEVYGVGDRIASKIYKSVYRSNLADLHKTYQKIHGVGDSKQLDISTWVRKQEQKFPVLLKSDFPGKETVLEEHRSENRFIKIQLRVTREAHAEYLELKSIAQAALSEMEWVSEKTYYQKLRGEEERSLNAYSLGVFPPWERPPAWYTQLLNEFGG